MTTVYTTSHLADILSTTTTVTYKRLAEAGIQPIAEHVSSAGRRYAVWGADAINAINAAAAVKAARQEARLAKTKVSKLRAAVKAAKVAARPAPAVAAPAPVVDLSIPLLNQVLAKLHELQNDIRAISMQRTISAPRQTWNPAPAPTWTPAPFDAGRFSLSDDQTEQALSMHDDPGVEVLTR